jgi:hypothetical protein
MRTKNIEPPLSLRERDRVRVPYLLGLLLLATACATASGTPGSADTLDTGARIVLHVDGERPRVVRPPIRREPVQVPQAQYEEAMVRLARQLRNDLPPRPAQRLEVISLGSPEQQDERTQLVRDYLQWCEKRGTPGDCRGLLKGRRYLTDEAKRDLAFALASAGVWEGTAAVIGEVLDPVQLELAVMSTLATTMVLLSIPEPLSKAVVITVTLCMVAYVGWDTVVGLITGWKRMEGEAKLARTFAELMDAGERYGRVMGEKVTRLLILLATAALGSAGGTALSAKNLPAFTQASRLAATESGYVLSSVGQVNTVKVTGRILTVSMAPGALAMASQGMSDGGSGPSSSASSSSSNHRLTSVESWRKPRLTEDGKILPFKGTREPPSPIPSLGRNRAGQTVSDGKHSLRFDKDGFPEFDTPFETLIDDVHIGSGNPPAHFRAANANLHKALEKNPRLAERLGLSQEEVTNLQNSALPPSLYTWHHHQDVGRMQLVLKPIHRLSRPHTGGMAIWGGGYSP